MKIGYLEIKLGAPWVHSLKEKRMIVRSIIAKVRQSFNVSIHEIGTQDEHQIITLGVTTGSNSFQLRATNCLTIWNWKSSR